MGIVCCSHRYKFQQHDVVMIITEGTRANAFLSLATQPEVRPFPLEYLIWFDATKFVLLSVSTPIETVCPKIRAKALPKNSTISFIRKWRSKTVLLKLAITATLRLHSKFLRLEVLHPFMFSVPYTLEWQNLFPFAQNCDKVHCVSLRNADALDGLFFVCLFFFFYKLRSWVMVQFNSKILFENRAERTTAIWRFRHNLIGIQNDAPLLAWNLKKTQLNSTVESQLTCHTLGEETSGYLIEVGCSGVRYRPNCGVCNVIVAVRCFVKNNYIFAT